ncbi:hypothetical protein D3C87_1816770 [compost metagenome]
MEMKVRENIVAPIYTIYCAIYFINGHVKFSPAIFVADQAGAIEIQLGCGAGKARRLRKTARHAPAFSRN